MYCLERYLDEIELLSFGAAAAYCVEYEGDLDSRAMRRAWDILCQKHSVLRSSITRDGSGLLLAVSSDSPDARFRVLKGGREDLQREVNGDWDPSSRTCELIIIAHDGRGHVALRVDHSVCDGHAVGALFAELWELYSSAARGAYIAVSDQNQLPASPARLMTDRLGWPLNEVAGEALSSTDATLFESINVPFVLAEEVSAKLICTAKAMMVSAHALISALILKQVRALSRLPSRPVPMSLLSVVDVRNRVKPPVGATETTNFYGLHHAVLDVDIESSVSNLAKHVSQSLGSALASLDIIRYESVLKLLTSPTDTPLEDHLSLVSISNVGVVPTLSQSADLKFANLFIVAPERTFVKYAEFGVSTYESRLRILFRGPSDYFNVDQVDGMRFGIEEDVLQL